MNRQGKNFTEAGLLNFIHSKVTERDKSIIVGIGDDAAVITSHKKTILTTDTQTSGVHFRSKDTPESIATKSCISSISDIFAMGGIPKYLLLSINAPKLNKNWCVRFINQLLFDLKIYNCALIGGNTSRSPTLSITTTVIGNASSSMLRFRKKATNGDKIYIGAPLGTVAIHQKLYGKIPNSNEWVHYSKRDVQASLLASSVIDLSDGLVEDLPKILGSKGAFIFINKIPLNHKLENSKKLSQREKFKLAITGGEDYTLCMTSKKNLTQFGYTQIGIVNNSNKICYILNKSIFQCSHGFKHFD
ncbi:MAG: thiamine-phosphate kinase [Methylacidiphilales bacterium]|nr:thiamine-phosphate kinase [Candidatus Methylacidiphilales bacterium]